MKNIKFLWLIAIGFIFLTSCSDDDNNKIPPVIRSSMVLVQSIQANNHVIELYSTKKNFMVGYNPIEIMIKDASNQEYYSNIEVSDFMPMMHMMNNHSHSCPKSEVFNKKEGIASGYAVFIMASDEKMPWDLSFTYKVNGNMYKVEGQKVTVLKADERKSNLTGGMDKDGNRYFIAYIEPQNPKTGVNNITAKVFMRKDMNNFPEMENYKILLDPRMPGMGNHSSPNNEDLMYDASKKMYMGKVNFSMTGYWKLNLQLQNPKGETILGNPLDKDNEASSLFWEIEF